MMTAWRWAALGAAATIFIGMSFGMVPGIDACGPPSGAGPWATFQTIASVADVRAMIRPDCAATFVPALRMSMWLDSLAFIPAFTLLLSAVVIAIRPPRWLLIGTLIILAGGAIADQLEGFSLLAILNALPGTADGVSSVVTAHIVKKCLLALTTAGVGLAVMLVPGWRRLAGGIALLGGLAALANLVVHIGGGEAGLLVSWLALSVVAVAGAVAEWRARRQIPAPSMHPH